MAFVALRKRIGRAIARTRGDQGLSQAGLAHLCGVRESTVQRWEAGYSAPNISRLQDVADALGCDPGALLNRQEPART